MAHQRPLPQLPQRKRIVTQDKHTSSVLEPTLNREDHQQPQGMEDNQQLRLHMAIRPSPSLSSQVMVCHNSLDMETQLRKAQWPKADISNLNMELKEATRLLLPATQHLALPLVHKDCHSSLAK